MKLSIRDQKGSPAGELEVGFPLVEAGKGDQAVHDVVVAYQAAQRMGTACTKTRSEVAGVNKKPWRQKGTGRARHGTRKSPIWVGGGVVFGPKPRDFSKKVNKATRKLALRKALTERLQSGDVLLVDDLKFEAPKTKGFLAVLDALEVEGSLLVVHAGDNDHLLLSARNVPGVDVTIGDSLNTYDVLRYDKLIVTQAAWEQIEQRLK
jgi:large subunit ribosomal protein L4